MEKCLLVAMLVLLATSPPSLQAEEPEAEAEAAELSCPRNASEEEMDECVVVEEAEFDSTIRVASFEFHRVETIFIILVFIIVVVLAKMGKCWKGLAGRLAMCQALL